MGFFDDIHRTLDRVAELQAQSAKDSAARQARHEEEMAKRQEKHEKEMAKRQEKHEEEMEEWRKKHEEEAAKRQAAEKKRRAEEEKRKAEEQERHKKYEEQVAKWRAEEEKWKAEERERWAEIDALEARSARKIGSIGKKLGSIGMNTGSFAEELFFTSLEENPVLGGQEYDIVRRNIGNPNDAAEYDILMHNGESTAIVEVKFKAQPSDIEKLLANEPKTFRDGFTGLKHHKIYLCLASTITNHELIQAAREAGIFLLGQKGESLEVVNSAVRSF